MSRPSIAAAVILLVVTIHSMAGALPTTSLMDYGSFYASGRAASEGLDPYAIYPLTFHVVLPGFESWNPNLNPPVSLPLFEFFATANPHVGFRLWWAFSFVCYVAAVGLLLWRYGRNRWLAGLWAVSMAGFWDTLALGQIYLVLVLAAVGAWLLLDRGRPILAGLLIGLVVAVKPNFLVWPALLLLAGHVRPVAAAAGAALLLNLAALLIYGAEVYLQWAALVLGDSERALFLTNASLSGLAQRLGSPELGMLLSAGLLAVLALRAMRHGMSLEQASALGLLGAVMASPIAWVHYTLFLLPIFFTAPASPLLLASAALLVVPVHVVLQFLEADWWLQVSLGSVYGWAVILCFAGIWSHRGIHGAPGQGRPLPQSG